MVSSLKAFYSRPFLRETRSPLEIVVYRLFLAFAWAAYRFRYRRALRQTRTFVAEAADKIREEGRSAFVFANGPSMADIDLEKIRDLCETGAYDLIAINSYLSNSADIAPPRFAVFADNVHFSGADTQYTRDIETCQRLGIPYFAPAKYVDGVDPLRRGYCSLSHIDAANTANIARPAGYYGVTAFFALSLAKMLGYRRIYICGYDNSYFRDFEVGEDGAMFIRHKHYYDDETEDTRVPCLYCSSSEFFFDTYRHFKYLEKIAAGESKIINVARRTFLSDILRDMTLDIYKNAQDANADSNEVLDNCKCPPSARGSR